MTKYEIMYIISPVLEENAIKEKAKSYEKVLKDNNASITNVTDWGMRELAYEIKKQKTGHYYIINIEASDAVAINEFDRLALIDENILRHLIIKEEK